MKDKSFSLGEEERVAAAKSLDAGLATRDLNDPPERKAAIYNAFEARDARFDGRVYAAVSSTGVYCRPVCPYHAKIDNITFFASAAEAEAAGYRPCLVCRPETAPGLSAADARANLARRAASLIREECTTGDSLARLSTRLGYTDRHVRRVFEEEYGVTPMRFLSTCRCSLAKSLLADTDLPISQVALAAGFKSTRRFNDAFKEHYGLVPSSQRRLSRSRGRGSKTPGTSIKLKLGYRPPFRFCELLSFFRSRAIAGVELVDESSYARCVRIQLDDGKEACGWLRITDDATHNALVLSMSESLLAATSIVVARIRRMFDLDCEPAVIHESLMPLEKVRPGANAVGMRLPGCFDSFETCCRAVLGQQVSVVAANKLAARVAETLGPRIETGVEGLNRAWPTPAEVLALDDISDALGPLGVIRSRSTAIREIAHMMEAGDLHFDALSDATEQMEALQSIKGIGPWTANYIAMRVLSYPDAFLETDAGVAHALPDLTPKERLAAVEPCRPWRSYAVVGLWNSLAVQETSASDESANTAMSKPDSPSKMKGEKESTARKSALSSRTRKKKTTTPKKRAAAKRDKSAQ